LAKSLFDCREYDRCAAVFLPDSLLSSVLASRVDSASASSAAGKGNGKASSSSAVIPLPKLSQKSLFLALYAKFMSGEKRRNEDSEMVMGPQDLGTVANKQLLVIGRFLATWFEERTTEDDEVLGSQGWLEYLCVLILMIWG
jgi:anaphase-promoting complex subunit 8